MNQNHGLGNFFTAAFPIRAPSLTNDRSPRRFSSLTTRMNLPADSMSGRNKGAVLLIMALWALVFMVSSQAWRYGDYYDYGWYVPPLALLIFLRRWR